jgi:hypothetical protein
LKRKDGEKTKKTGKKPKESGVTVEYLRRQREKEWEDINKRSDGVDK